MNVFLEVIRPVLPLVVVSGIVLFVILRMKHKYKNGILGKKKSKKAQQILDSLIPLGMLMGLVIAIFLSLFSFLPLLAAIAWGPGIGLFLGYIAYEIYSKEREE